MISKFWSTAFVLLVLLGCKEATPKPEANNDAVQLTEKTIAQPSYQDLDGKPISLADFKGKRVVLSYWATWCRPCIEEMPSMLRAQELLKNEDYLFLLASDQEVEKIKTFKESKKFDFNFVKFNGTFADKQIYALPATFIYNKAGEQVTRIEGATEWDSPEMIQKLKDIQ